MEPEELSPEEEKKLDETVKFYQEQATNCAKFIGLNDIAIKNITNHIRSMKYNPWLTHDEPENDVTDYFQSQMDQWDKEKALSKLSPQEREENERKREEYYERLQNMSGQMVSVKDLLPPDDVIL